MALLIYLPSLSTPFSYDDVPLVPGNALLRDGAGLRTLLLSARMTSAPIWPGHYRPLLMLTLWVQYQLAGATPWSYRLVNLALHLANGALLYLLVRRLLARVDGTRAALTAALAAGLWLLHPINALAVTLVLKRNTSLCVLLELLALLAFLRQRDRGAVVLGAAALLVKEDALALPLLAALAAACDSGRVPWRRIWPLAVFPLGMAIWALLRHHQGGAAWAYAGAQPIAVTRYLRMLVDPRAIAAAYDLEPALSWPRALGLLAIVPVLAAAWLLRRRRPLIALAIAWTAVALAPSSSLIPIAPAMDQIRVYLAFVPLFVLVAAGLVRLRYWAPAALVLAAILGRLTLDEAALWDDSPSLWAQAVARYPDSKIGNRALCETRAEPAQCRRAVELWPDDPFTRYDLVAALARSGDREAARTVAALAVAEMPRAAVTWLAAGHVAWMADDREAAERDYRTALALEPDHESARIHLADLLASRDPHGADQLIRPLMRVRPSDPSDAALLDSVRARLR